MNRRSTAVCAALLVLIGAEPATRPSQIARPDIGDSVIIVGDLGLPVGQETTITGIKKANGPLQDMFTVEAIDGVAAPKRLRIRVDGIGNWTDGTRATLRGYEIGTLRFLHLDETNFGPNDDRWTGPYQKLFLSFHVSEVTAPKGLEVSPKR